MTPHIQYAWLELSYSAFSIPFISSLPSFFSFLAPFWYVPCSSLWELRPSGSHSPSSPVTLTLWWNFSSFDFFKMSKITPLSSTSTQALLVCQFTCYSASPSISDNPGAFVLNQDYPQSTCRLFKIGNLCSLRGPCLVAQLVIHWASQCPAVLNLIHWTKLLPSSHLQTRYVLWVDCFFPCSLPGWLKSSWSPQPSLLLLWALSTLDYHCFCCIFIKVSSGAVTFISTNVLNVHLPLLSRVQGNCKSLVHIADSTWAITAEIMNLFIPQTFFQLHRTGFCLFVPRTVLQPVFCEHFVRR